MDNSTHSYTGVWTNWSHGRAKGMTLTLEQQHAGFLTAFLAVYVSFAGGMFWRIISYILHQAHAVPPSERRDFLHYARQVVFRNSGTATGGAAVSLVWLTWTSWKKMPGAALRCLPYALLAMIILAGFGASGVLTSYAVKSPGNETVIIGPECGGYAFNVSNNASDANNQIPLYKQIADANEALTYVKQCYESSSLACTTYVRPSLPYTVDYNATCPFNERICMLGAQSAYAMDTGLLDTHEDLGINAPPKDRLKFRRRTTCTPIYGGDFLTTRYDETSGWIIYVETGPYPLATNDYVNYTFSYVNHTKVDDVGYMLQAIQALSDPLGNFTGIQWIPDPQLNTTDADISLMMLAQNTMAYYNPSDDPWIPAHLKLFPDVAIWNPDYYLNFLGCIDQYQICNPNMDSDLGCSKLGGSISVTIDLNKRWLELGLNLPQMLTVPRLLRGQDARGIGGLIKGRGASALRIAESVDSNIQYYVPPNQWQVEATSWFATSLAMLQAYILEWATEPKNFPAAHGTSTATGWYWTPPDPEFPGLAKQCQNQLVRDNGDVENISILALAVILALGGFIIILGLSIDLIVGALRRAHARYKTVQWDVEETQGLLKTVYGGTGLSGKTLPHSSTFSEPEPESETGGQGKPQVFTQTSRTQEYELVSSDQS